MLRVRLIHWHAREAAERATRLVVAGFAVDHEIGDPPALMRELKRDPPDAIVIDLTRIPSQGRDFAIALRSAPGTRSVPLVFVGGEPAKVARVRELLPDAAYLTWERLAADLGPEVERAPREPVVPGSRMAAYSGAPLPKKLGIKPGATVRLLDAPPRFANLLDPLPADVKVVRGWRGRCDLALWFVRSRRDLERRLTEAIALIGPDGLWIAWPKKTSGVTSDLTQQIVRELGMAAGLVDFKIAAIDDTWSGLRFTVREPA